MLKCQRLSSTSKTSKEMGTTFGISDFWDRLGGQGLIMIGWWYSGKPLTNHKQRLSTKRSHKSLRCEPVPTALIVSVIGNSISLKAAYDCLTQGAIYVPCKWTDSVWLWRWLPHRLSKRQSLLSTTTVLFRIACSAGVFRVGETLFVFVILL